MTAPPRFAVVDDEPDLRETVGYALRREGFRVELHADGLAAWEVFARGLPDVAVLDILLPRLDGRELCRRLRALSERLPILFLTSRDEEFDRVLGLELGADDTSAAVPCACWFRAYRVLLRRRRCATIRGGAEDRCCAGQPGSTSAAYQARVGHPCSSPSRVPPLHALARHPVHVRPPHLLAEAYPPTPRQRPYYRHPRQRLRRKLAEWKPGRRI